MDGVCLFLSVGVVAESDRVGLDLLLGERLRPKLNGGVKNGLSREYLGVYPFIIVNFVGQTRR